MILVADSGSTKTEWALARDTEDIVFFKASGYNPYFDHQERWSEEIAGWFHQEGINPDEINYVYYYGAGCDTSSHKKQVEEAIRKILPHAGIVVEDDLTGAAKALFGRERGVILILGTGTNAGLWDGESFIKRSLPLGYLLGDHGSGAVLGLRLVKAWLDHELSPALSKIFADQYKINVKALKEELYLKGKPNYYLAGFSPFLWKHQSDKRIRSIIMDEFAKLFDIQLKPLFAAAGDKIRATGSVAYFYQELLLAVAQKRGIEIDKIIQYPLKNLVTFHLTT